MGPMGPSGIGLIGDPGPPGPPGIPGGVLYPGSDSVLCSIILELLIEIDAFILDLN